MTRGRKKDLTIPPTRALAQQRDYRARKAQYISSLEERCRNAEEENVRLRKELELAKAGLPASALYSSDTVQASSELKQHLTTAAEALARFQHLAFPDIRAQLPPPPALPPVSNILRPASFPSPAPSPPFFPFSSAAAAAEAAAVAQRDQSVKPLPGPSTLLRNNSNRLEASLSRSSHSPSPSPSVDSECCGGYVDCSSFPDREEDDAMEDEELEDSSSRGSYSRTSGVRSTSGGDRTSSTGRGSSAHDP